MKTITECESKHCKAWPLFSLVCAGVIATFMAGCAVREIPEYPYSTGNSVGNQARRAANASYQEERLATFQKNIQMNLPQQLPQLDAARWNTYLINY
jgi:hypothetical protein